MALLRRLRRRGHLERPGTDGLVPAAWAERLPRHLPRLGAAAGTAAYKYAPGVGRLVTLDKPRLLYRFALPDAVLQAWAAARLTDAFEAVLAPSVFSYRRGRSPLGALREAGAWLSNLAPDAPRFVTRLDVKSYGDEIPTGPDSRLWSLLAAATAQDRHQALLAHVVRGTIAASTSSTAAATTARGLPTGSPLLPPLANLYLSPLDTALAAIPDTCAWRYGDDLLVLAASAAAHDLVTSTLARELASLGLRSNTTKELRAPFTRNGASGSRQYVEYLGYRLDAAGRIGLKSAHVDALLTRIEQRIARTGRLLRTDATAERLAVFCAVVSQTLTPGHPDADPAAERLAHAVDDRGQLRELDRRLATLVARAVSGRRGPRVLRDVAERELRATHGLRSLERARNRGSRRES